MTLSDLERGTRGVKLFRRISLITIIPFDLERPNSTRQHMWRRRRVYYGVSHAPISRAAPQRIPNFGLLSYLCLQSSVIAAERPNWRGKNIWLRLGNRKSRSCPVYILAPGKYVLLPDITILQGKLPLQRSSVSDCFFSFLLCSFNDICIVLYAPRENCERFTARMSI